MGIFSTLGVVLFGTLLHRRKKALKVVKEKDEESYLKYLSECSARESSSGEIADSASESSLERVESILVPLISCIDVIQKSNPLLKDFPDLITPSVDQLTHPCAIGMGATIGSLSGASATPLGRYWDRYKWNEVDHAVPKDESIRRQAVSPDEEEADAKKAVERIEDESFDLYCQCRQFIDATERLLRPKEIEVLQSILERAEGEGYRKKYEQLLNPQNATQTDDDAYKPLVLPMDFFDSSAFFDPDALVIGCLSDTILRGGAQRFAMMIDTLASRSFGYIQPTLGNKKLLVSRLTGRNLPTTCKDVQWIEKKTRSVSETEKVMLWMTNFMFGGGYDRAYDILNLERTIKPGQETANLKNADKVFRSRIESLYRKV